jgi:hypothetical protein
VSGGSFVVDLGAAIVKKIRNRPKAVARRKARRGEPESQVLNTAQEVSMAIDIGTRTSTNSGVAGIVAIVLIKALAAIAPDFAPPEGFEAGITAVVMYVIARFSKSPATPKAL